MSSFANGSGLNVTVHAETDPTCPDSWVLSSNQDGFQTPLFVPDAWTTAGGVYWDCGDCLIGEDNGLGWLYSPGDWDTSWPNAGVNGRLSFVGYTRDQYGSALGGCTVRLYRASTEELVAKVTSDANGLYYATSPYSDAHFMVIHNAAGDRAGATANTLIPA